jgi:formate/nitrite transporter FocA (FNT family)
MGKDDVSEESSESSPGGEQKPQKSYGTILDQELESGLTELERPAAGLLLSGLSAGLDVSFSLLLMAIMSTRVEGHLPGPIAEILIANTYAVGFLFVVLGRSELFTEHTTLAVLPMLAGKSSVGRLVRLWGIIYASNLVGAAAFAALTVLIAPALHVADIQSFGRIASGLVEHPSWVMLLSAVLAGWLMGLLSWLVAASRDTIGQIVIVWLVTVTIGFCHLHHSVVGTAEVLSGVFSGSGVTLADFGRFLGLSTLGNILGGFFFVALIKWGHARASSDHG